MKLLWSTKTSDQEFFKFWESQLSAINEKSDFEFMSPFMNSGGQ